jgi:hypothetical protein
LQRKEDTVLYRVLPLCLVVLALALFVVTVPVLAADVKDKADQADTHEGTVVSATATKLVMKGTKDGKEVEMTHTIAPDAKVTLDGKDAKIDELKPGQKIRVTTKKGDEKTVVKVEALDKNKDFPKEKE